MRAAVARGRACTNSYSFDESGECQEIECQEFQIVRCECQEILLRKAFKWHPLYASVEPWDEVRWAPPPTGRTTIEPFPPNVATWVKLQCQEIVVSRNSVCAKNSEFKTILNQIHFGMCRRISAGSGLSATRFWLQLANQVSNSTFARKYSPDWVIACGTCTGCQPTLKLT